MNRRPVSNYTRYPDQAGSDIGDLNSESVVG